MPVSPVGDASWSDGKLLLFPGGCRNFSSMTKPLALILYESLMPGSKVVNHMQDLGYRVQSLSNPAQLVELAQKEKPMLVIADLVPHHARICEAIGALKSNPSTEHIPVLAVAGPKSAKQVAEATAAGARLVANSTALLDQLPQLLEQLLQVE
jgi:PleD family two-component response regulator